MWIAVARSAVRRIVSVSFMRGPGIGGIWQDRRCAVTVGGTELPGRESCRSSRRSPMKRG